MAPTDKGDFDVIIDDARWRDALGDAEALAARCKAAAMAFDPRLGEGAALLLADDETLKDLNSRFRNIDKPTNVLSFPSGGGDDFLGDIAIAFDTCDLEAKAQGIAFRDHVTHLIVHGLLHLAGYDHEADEEAERMESLETDILARLGVADPYCDAHGAEGETAGRP